LAQIESALLLAEAMIVPMLASWLIIMEMVRDSPTNVVNVKRIWQSAATLLSGCLNIQPEVWARIVGRADYH